MIYIKRDGLGCMCVMKICFLVFSASAWGYGGSLVWVQKGVRSCRHPAAGTVTPSPHRHIHTLIKYLAASCLGWCRVKTSSTTAETLVWPPVAAPHPHQANSRVSSDSVSLGIPNWGEKRGEIMTFYHHALHLQRIFSGIILLPFTYSL